MKNIWLLLSLVIPISLSAQTEGSGFNNTGRGGTATTFATDYQALGINPANIGLDSAHVATFGMLETGLSFYSEALQKTDVQKMFFGGDNIITEDEATELGKLFSEEGMTVNYDIRLLGFKFDIGKSGALAFAIDTRASHYSIFGPEASGLIFEGYDYTNYFDTIITIDGDPYGVAYEPVSLSEITDGTVIKASADIALNGGWSTKIYQNENLKVYMGAGVKYVMSYAYFDFSANGSQIGGITAIAGNPFELDASETPSNIYSTAKPVGKGWGFDVGVTAELHNRLTFGASVIDIGNMHYKANLISFNDYVVDTINFAGVDYTNPLLLIQDIVEDEALLQYYGIEDYKVAMPARLRLGAGYRVFKNLTLGADLVMPLADVAGNFPDPAFGLGAELRLAQIFKFSSGFSFGAGYKSAIPFGFGIDLDFWEIGFATRDITTWFGQQSPYVSIAMGLLRFKI